MNRGLFLVIFLLIFLAVIAGAIGGESWKSEVTFRYHQLRGQTTTITINEKTFPVEVAMTPAERALGLSGRKQLRSETGMLFVFDSQDYWSFWMKDTLVPLDIIWVSDTRIVDIEENVPTTTAENPPTYQPAHQANFVLEFDAGTVAAQRWQVGNTVEIKDVDNFTK